MPFTRYAGALLAGLAVLATTGCAGSRRPDVPSGTIARPSVRLNQLGFAPDGPKRAVVASASAAPLAWRLMGPGGAVVAEGRTQVFGQDRYSGEHVHQADFSDVEAPGENYRLQVGEAVSRPFAIREGLLDRLPYDALAYFYHNRAGTPIEARYVGERWARPAGHAPERATCFSGADESGNVWPGCDYTLDVSGGWYDAGDHGKYVVNGGIALWTLLNWYEREAQVAQQQQQGGALFRDGSASIPEAGNGVSDLLDEARWQTEFMLSMQVPEGNRTRVPVGVKRGGENLPFSEIDASGMAHHKVADERWTSLPTAPHEDTMTRLLYPPSTGATLNLAAVAAQCARVWRQIDPAFSARCMEAAERAWAAARRNPEIYAVGNFTGSGGYGDGDLSDEFYWAAAELFATTGEAQYRQVLTTSPHHAGAVQSPTWGSTAALGTITLALVPSGLGAAEQQGQQQRIVAGAEGFLRDRERVGYHVPFAPENYAWGSNSDVLNRAMLLGLAHDFTGEERFRAGMVDAMDYLLGRNPLDQSYISGWGVRALEHPHHRFWANTADGRYPPPPPGAVSGGPNSGRLADDVAREVHPCAPMGCWRDDIDAYSLNEVAINWNAPLVWVAAYLAESEPRD